MGFVALHGDSIGSSTRSIGSTAVDFPKLANRFGPSVTYDERPHGHIRAEFAFNIAELSDGDFRSEVHLATSAQTFRGSLSKKFPEEPKVAPPSARPKFFFMEALL